MKKLVLFFAFALLISAASYGQFALGVKVGYNTNKLSTNLDTVKSQANNGFHVGVWARFGKRFYISPELKYTMSGALFTNEGKLSANNWKQKITIGKNWGVLNNLGLAPLLEAMLKVDLFLQTLKKIKTNEKFISHFTYHHGILSIPEYLRSTTKQFIKKFDRKIKPYIRNKGV